MKKLIFGLGVFFTSVFGIISSVALEIAGKVFLELYYFYPASAMELTGYCLFAFTITAAIGFVFALIGAFSRDKSKNEVSK